MNPRKLIVPIAMAVLAVVVLPIAANSSTKSQKLTGMVTEITGATLTIDNGQGREVTLQTSEDYSDRIPLGTKVTAWYHQEGGTEGLDRIEYPLELSPASPQDFIPKVKKVILLPSSNAGDASAFYAEVEHLLETRFHWVVAHRMLAEEIRRRDSKAHAARATKVARAAELPPEPLEAASPELIQKVAEGTRADAVMEMRVEYILLKVKSYTAEWDGQRETFGSTKSRVASAITFRPARGQLPVATVVLRFFDRRGQLLWSNRRGFRVLAMQAGGGGDFRDLPLPEAVADASFLANWLNQTFASWLNPDSKAASANSRN